MLIIDLVLSLLATGLSLFYFLKEKSYYRWIKFSYTITFCILSIFLIVGMVVDRDFSSQMYGIETLVLLTVVCGNIVSLMKNNIVDFGQRNHYGKH